MNINHELYHTYRKTVRVIYSCNTISQYRGAMIYTKLFLRILPLDVYDRFRDALHTISNYQLKVIKKKHAS